MTHFWPSPESHVPQDNALAHTARANRDFLQQYNTRIRPWPALSPDLTQIEHSWDEIQRKLIEVRPCPITAADLSVAFLRIWAAIQMAFFNRLIYYMCRRWVSVVNAPTDACDATCTSGIHYPVSGEDMCYKFTFSHDSTRVFVHLNNKHTDT